MVHCLDVVCGIEFDRLFGYARNYRTHLRYLHPQRDGYYIRGAVEQYHCVDPFKQSCIKKLFPERISPELFSLDTACVLLMG